MKTSCKSWIWQIVLAGLVFVMPVRLFALELNRCFSDDMVLQREKPVKVWGTAKAGDTVSVSFGGQTAKAITDEDGRWVATLKPMPANAKGQALKVISGAAAPTLNNVVVGDVFLFARQSSIDVALGTTAKGRQAAAAHVASQSFRFINIKTYAEAKPLANLQKEATSGWRVVDKQSALAMSAAAFYLGRDLVNDAKVPVGIVDLHMGHHYATAWLSAEGFEQCTNDDNERMVKSLKYKMRRLNEHIEKTKKSQPPDRSVLSPGLSTVESPVTPTVCYNAVLHSLRGLTLKGILLQLGNNYPYVAFSRLRETGKSTDNSWLFKASKGFSGKIHLTRGILTIVLPIIVDDLRRSLGEAQIPLAWIMPGGTDVVPYASHMRGARELQRRAQMNSKAVDLILPGSDHVPFSGQPADEELLAARCRQWVMGTFYGGQDPASGPLFERVEFNQQEATIHFREGTAEGLAASGDALKHFEMAESAREFVHCEAVIEGKTIKLHTLDLDKPVYVRFGWSLKPVQGLVNKAGLPAIPFTTEDQWGFESKQQAKSELTGEYHKPANTWPKSNCTIVNGANSQGVHLGPTGLWGRPSGQNIWVTTIDPDSPADGKVLRNDVIYGANGKGFGTEREVIYYFANAITEAETREAGGRLILHIWREGNLIKVPIQLQVMGSFSTTTPWDCEKSSNIVARAEEYMRKGLRPETGLPNNGRYMYGPWHDPVFFLMAAGNPELQGLVRRHIRNTTKALDAWKAGEPHAFNTNKGWSFSYLKMLFGEYYHLTGDRTVLPYLEAIDNGTFKRDPKPGKEQSGAPAKAKPKPEADASSPAVEEADAEEEVTPGKAWSWPPTEASWHGVHPAGQMPSTMGSLLAYEAGLKINKDKLLFNLKHLYVKRAEYGYVKYQGYGPKMLEWRQVAGPKEILPIQRNTGTYSSMNGKLGTAAALFSMVPAYKKAVDACSIRCVYAFNHTRAGHGGAWFNNFWTPIGAYHAGPEKCTHFMKNQQWWRELYRDHTGSMWQEHNAKGKSSVLATGFAIHRAMHRKKLRMFGAPRSLFAPDAPAYMKPAVAAHRSRDYALAEKLTLKILADQKTPAKDRPRVLRFLDSVQTLKKSIEHDLAFTEELIKKGNYVLANEELPQLQMVAPPNIQPRLTVMARILESEKAKAEMTAAAAQAKQDQAAAIKARGLSKAASKEDFEKDLASLVALVKDGGKYTGPKFGRRGNTAYPTYPEKEQHRWRIQVMESLKDTPQGWELPAFDDSKWGEVSLPTAWRPAHAALLRTTFEVKDVTAFKTLRVRAKAASQRNMTLYLNGEVVAKVSSVPEGGGLVFSLKPESLKLLRNGKNSLAISTLHGLASVNFGFRLEGIPK